MRQRVKTQKTKTVNAPSCSTFTLMDIKETVPGWDDHRELPTVAISQ